MSKAERDWEQLNVDVGRTSRAALIAFGAKAQVWKAIEEFSELIRALSRYESGRGTVEEIEDELADCSIMLTQMAYLFTDEKTLIATTERKMRRLEKLIEAENATRTS